MLNFVTLHFSFAPNEDKVDPAAGWRGPQYYYKKNIYFSYLLLTSFYLFFFLSLPPVCASLVCVGSLFTP